MCCVHRRPDRLSDVPLLHCNWKWCVARPVGANTCPPVAFFQGMQDDDASKKLFATIQGSTASQVFYCTCICMIHGAIVVLQSPKTALHMSLMPSLLCLCRPSNWQMQMQQHAWKQYRIEHMSAIIRQQAVAAS